MTAFDPQAARQAVLTRQLQGLVQGVDAVEFSVHQVNTPAVGVGATGTIVVPHELGKTPVGALALPIPGGGLLSAVPIEAATSLGGSSVSFSFRNNAGFALGASTLKVAVVVWA